MSRMLISFVLIFGLIFGISNGQLLGGERGLFPGQNPFGQIGDNAEDVLSSLAQPLNRFPLVGVCDRIAYRGVMNCMENYLPSRRSFGNQLSMCCGHYKYQACIFGLHDGLRAAMEFQKCPASYSARIIRSMGDGVVSSSIKSLCKSFDGGRCSGTGPVSGSGSGSGNKKKRVRNEVGSASEGAGDLLQPMRGLFSGF